MTNKDGEYADNYTYEGVVLSKDEDGFEIINYPTHTDRGSVSFSLTNFEKYQELMAQDELQEEISTYMMVYKQGD